MSFYTYENEKKQIINVIKNMDYDKMREVFNLMYKDENFKREIYNTLRVYKKLKKIDNRGSSSY